MKLFIIIASSLFFISMSYLNRTKTYSGNELKNTEEFWNGNDQSAILRFCQWQGHTDVAFVKSEEKKLKIIVCANN